METTRLKAAELRIGNIVQTETEYDAYIIRISAICENCIHTPSGRSHCSIAYKELRSVPLSAEVLVSWCGFTPDDSQNVFRKKHFRVTVDPRTCCAYAILGQRKYPVTSLHQLQNLYHAIMGEELNIAPTKQHIVIKSHPKRESLDILLQRDAEKLQRIKEMRNATSQEKDANHTE